MSMRDMRYLILIGRNGCVDRLNSEELMSIAHLANILTDSVQFVLVFTFLLLRRIFKEISEKLSIRSYMCVMVMIGLSAI